RSDLKRDPLACNRLHLDFAPEDSIVQRDGHFRYEVIALALEARMRPHPNDDVEVASWTAHARASFARQTHPGAVSRPGWAFSFPPPGAHPDPTDLADVPARPGDLAA